VRSLTKKLNREEFNKKTEVPVGKVKSILQNKGGWIRIVEAVVAVLIIASAFTFLLIRNQQKRTGDEASQLGRALISQITNDDELRGEILKKDLSSANSALIIKGDSVYNFIEERVPDYLGWEIKVCKVNFVCGMNEFIEKQVYVNEAIISSNLEEYDPKKIKLFIWEK